MDGLYERMSVDAILWRRMASPIPKQCLHKFESDQKSPILLHFLCSMEFFVRAGTKSVQLTRVF